MSAAKKKLCAKLVFLATLPCLSVHEMLAQPLAQQPAKWGRANEGDLRILFEDYALDTDTRELTRGTELISLPPKAFDLLTYLVQNRERVVSKDDLFEAIWLGRIVSESTLTSHINTVRKALGDSGENQRLIRTVARKGVRFVGEIKEQLKVVQRRPASLLPTEHNASDQSLAGLPEGVRHGSAPPLPDKPSIAVLPFSNLSGDPEQEYFVDGMVEEIITALSRIRWLFVIARVSSFTYKGQAVDVKQVSRELGVRYVLEGSVRKSGNRVRITGQLIDAVTGAHLWADRFDSSVEDLFDLQDKVASSVAGIIEPALQAAETMRSANRPTADLTAYDLYLRAYAMVLSSVRHAPEALCLLEQAIARDPCYGPALAWAAICCLRLVFDDRSEDQAADSLKGIDFARRAVEVAGDDPGTLANAAQVLAFFGEDIGTMTALVDRALSFNPNYARGWHISGTLRLWAGQPDIAIEHMDVALRLSPRARIGQSLAAIGRAHLLARRFEAAIPKLLLAIQEDPSFPNPYFSLAVCYANMGQLDNAREILARLRAVSFDVMPRAMHDIGHFRDPQHREFLLSGLRLAAGETI